MQNLEGIPRGVEGSNFRGEGSDSVDFRGEQINTGGVHGALGGAERDAASGSVEHIDAVVLHRAGIVEGILKGVKFFLIEGPLFGGQGAVLCADGQFPHAIENILGALQVPPLSLGVGNGVGQIAGGGCVLPELCALPGGDRETTGVVLWHLQSLAAGQACQGLSRLVGVPVELLNKTE